MWAGKNRVLGAAQDTKPSKPKRESSAFLSSKQVLGSETSSLAATFAAV